MGHSINSAKSITFEVKDSTTNFEPQKVMTHGQVDRSIMKDETEPRTLEATFRDDMTAQSCYEAAHQSLEEKNVSSPSGMGMKALSETIQTPEDESHGLKQEIESLKDEIRELKEEHGEREANFQEAQADALALLEKNSIDAMPDDEVSQEIQGIFGMCRGWVKKHYSDPPLSAIKAVKETVRIMLGGRGPKNSASGNGLQAASDGSIGTRHLLMAMLARYLTCGLFCRPFF